MKSSDNINLKIKKTAGFHLEKIYKNKKVLITGGLGFIGSNLAIKLVEYGADVTIVDSLISDYGGNLFNIESIKDKVNVNISDMRDKYSMGYLIKNQEILFNLAGTLSHIDSMIDPFTDLEINCVSQLSLLEACRHNNPTVKIIYSGTRNQYGKARYLPVDEKHPLEPTDINGINCNTGEAYHLLYNKYYGIRSCSLRLTNTFGPRHQMKNPKQGILNWFIRQIIDKEKIRLFGTGEQIRDINYVDDVVQALLFAGASDDVWGNIYNIGGEATSLVDFVKVAIDVFGKGDFETVSFPQDRKKIEIGDYIADYSKIKDQLGWQPKVKFEKGLRVTFKYYEKNKNFYW